MAYADEEVVKVVLNRYQKAKPSVGFIRGFGLRKGAICSSVSHDSHNIVAIGVDDESIVKVINAVVASKLNISPNKKAKPSVKSDQSRTV